MALGFPLARDANPQSIFEDIQQGLSELLVQMPLLGCRRLYEDPITKKRYGKRNAQSAVRCYYQDLRSNSRYRQRRGTMDYNNLRASGFPVLQLEEDFLFLPHDLPQNALEGPFSYAQANFMDNGLILCFGIMHVGIDLMAWRTAFQLLSQNIARASAGLSYDVDIPLLPPRTHDRSRFTAPRRSQPGSPPVLPAGYRVERRVLPAMQPFIAPTPPPRASTVWAIDTHHLQSLKTSVLATSSHPTRLSTMNILTALIWSAVQRARSTTNSLPDRPSRILTAIDVRKRIPNPPSAEYIGVCSAMVGIAADSTTLLEPSLSALHTIATTIRSTLTSDASTQLCDQLISAYNSLAHDEVLARDPPDLLFADHSSMDTASLDWGAKLGRAEMIREPYVARAAPIGECMFLPKRADGAIEFSLSLEEHEMRALRRDPLLARFAVCVCRGVDVHAFLERDAAVSVMSRL